MKSRYFAFIDNEVLSKLEPGIVRCSKQETVTLLKVFGRIVLEVDTQCSVFSMNACYVRPWHQQSNASAPFSRDDAESYPQQNSRSGQEYCKDSVKQRDWCLTDQLQSLAQA